MNDINDQFYKEAKKQDSVHDLAEAVGLPDEHDRQRIQQYLLRYEKEHPGEIAFHIGMARANFREQGGDRQKYGLSNKQAHGRTLFELPVNLGKWLEEAYPLMFRNKKHTAWFAKNFPELLIPEKY